jgi:hypothetical protein
MMQRGRKGLARSETPGAVAVVDRPEAPLDLTPEETDEWHAVVDAMPADWFPRETWSLLRQWCRHTVCARRVAQLIDAEMSREELDLAAIKDLTGMQHRETTALKALAAAMRLAQQSTYNAKNGSTATRRTRGRRRRLPVAFFPVLLVLVALAANLATREGMREVFVPLTHPPGHAKVDFGEALGVIGGVRRKLHYFAMALPHSDAFFIVSVVSRCRSCSTTPPSRWCRSPCRWALGGSTRIAPYGGAVRKGGRLRVRSVPIGPPFQTTPCTVISEGLWRARISRISGSLSLDAMTFNSVLPRSRKTFSFGKPESTKSWCAFRAASCETNHPVIV